MTEPKDAEWLTVAEVAAILRTKPGVISRMLKAGTLPGVFLGERERWRVRRADVDALVRKGQKDGQP